MAEVLARPGSLRLREIAADAYARLVLPLTAELWAGRRDFDTYVRQTRDIAHSGYGRRAYRTIGLFDGEHLLASCKTYERTVKDGRLRLRALGIGAVFTPVEQRGCGYASAMLAMLLDRCASDGHDLAFLYSDIRPAFYADLGFIELPSRSISFRADLLPKSRVEVDTLRDTDWAAIRSCYAAFERLTERGFTRPPLVWEWIRLRVRHDSEHTRGTPANLVIRDNGSVAAYVFGVRIPERDAYVFDEFGFADARWRELVAPLLRSAAGDLQRVAGWLPPAGARELIPRGSVRKRTDAILMMAPVSPHARRMAAAIAARRADDFAWSTDHI